MLGDYCKFNGGSFLEYFLANACFLFNEMPLLVRETSHAYLANEAFRRIPQRGSVSWTSKTITSLHTMGDFEGALVAFFEMIRCGAMPSRIILTAVLSSCAALGELDTGRKVHAFVVKFGMGTAVAVANSLINMYAKSGDARAGVVVFGRMRSRSVSSWNSLLSLHAQSGKMDLARETFEEMPDRNVVSWSALVAGYNYNNLNREALELFSSMLKGESATPDHFTLTSALSACSSLGMLEQGKQIHSHIIRTEMPCHGQLGNALISMYAKSGAIELARTIVLGPMASDLNVISLTALLEGYLKLGELRSARETFDLMNLPDVVAWTAMIVGYVQNGLGNEAVDLFRMMIDRGPKPNHCTLAAMLSACSSLASLVNGKEIHCQAIRSGQVSISISSSLITMYARSGSITTAKRVFHSIHLCRDTIPWSSMITAFAEHGQGEEAIALFEEMIGSGVRPDHITYVGVLSACAHAGLVQKGRDYFHQMLRNHMIQPTKCHFSCMIDLFARAGLLLEAKELIETMPVEADAAAWAALLAACGVHKEAGLAKMAAERLAAIDPENSGAYSALANLYSACGRWEAAAETRKLMREKGVKKEQGLSWIYVNNKIHVFGAVDRLHPEREAIYGMAAGPWTRYGGSTYQQS